MSLVTIQNGCCRSRPFRVPMAMAHSTANYITGPACPHYYPGQLGGFAGNGEAPTFLIKSEGGEAVSFGADVSKSDEVKALVQDYLNRYGRIDVLVNNVGNLAVGGPEKLDEEVWDHHMPMRLQTTHARRRHVFFRSHL